jgi:hypothetical protein
LKVRAAAVLAALAALLVAGCGGSGTPGAPAGPALGSLAASGAGNRFYEIYDPIGPARGTILLLHGGSWADRRGDARRMLATTALAFRASGWRVVNASYSPGWVPGRAPDPLPMLRDVVAFYDQIRHAFGGPVCAYGESAGGHLAAMLALERPSLRCAILSAAPLNLRTLLHQTWPPGIAAIRGTFGQRASVLREFSPTLLWNTGADPTAVFATAAANDQVVPPVQLTEFQQVDPGANAHVLPGAAAGSAGAAAFMHSDVRGSALFARISSLGSWLNGIAQPAAAGPTPTDFGAGCSSAQTPRWKLLLAGDAWQQSSTAGPAGQAIAATRGCSGSAKWQDDGLSLWALPSPAARPSPGATLASGAEATLALSSPHPVRRITVSFRGFLARPQDWVLGLYASTEAGATPTPVAGCTLGHCTGLRLVPSAGGGLLTAAGSSNNPDLSATPPSASFALPAGTRQLSWKLRCAAPGGCPLAGIDSATGASPRPRDPIGHPAIFSLYSVALGS